jgi:predicted nuclease of predicted toxin-antitoxin system
VKFLVDAQLPPALAVWLEQAGQEAAHVRDVGLREADDAAIWDYALQAESAIVTKDEDFVARAALEMGLTSPTVIWLRVGNTTNRVLIAWIDPRLPRIIELLHQGHRLIEVI